MNSKKTQQSFEITENASQGSEDDLNNDLSPAQEDAFESICSQIILFILNCLREDDEEIKEAALKINNVLQEEISSIISKKGSDKKINHENTLNKDITGFSGQDQSKNSFPEIFQFLKTMISDNLHSKSIYHAMKWIENLLDHYPKELM